MALLRRRSLVAAGATLAVAYAVRKRAGAGEADLRPLSVIVPITSPRPTPPITFTRLDGTAVTLASFQGRPIVLNFWATWCVPCVRELPELDALAASQPPTGIAVLAVSADRNGPAAVTPFLTHHPLPHITILLDHSNEAVHALGATGFPTTFILDAGGRVRAMLEGPAPWSTAATTVQRLTE